MIVKAQSEMAKEKNFGAKSPIDVKELLSLLDPHGRWAPLFCPKIDLASVVLPPIIFL